MVNLDDMLFEVSSELRLGILEELRDCPATITDISSRFGVSMTEASRHFKRLSQVGLIRKGPERDYSITVLGKTVLTQLGPLKFTTRHSDYFDSHDATSIPVKFLNRINELSDATPTYIQRANIMRSVEKIKNTSYEAEEYYLSILDTSSMNVALYGEPDKDKTDLLERKVSRGVKYRALLPTIVEPNKIQPKALRDLIKLSMSKNFEFRITERIDIFLFMNEKEVTLLAFPTMNNGFDYLGFEASDRRSIEWCNELFNHYWNKSKPFYIGEG